MQEMSSSLSNINIQQWQPVHCRFISSISETFFSQFISIPEANSNIYFFLFMKCYCEAASNLKEMRTAALLKQFPWAIKWLQGQIRVKKCKNPAQDTLNKGLIKRLECSLIQSLTL